MTKGSGKVRRTARYRYLVADPTEASQALADARMVELRARNTDGHDGAQKALAVAQEQVDACFGVIVLRALAPSAHQEFVQQWTERDESYDAAVKAAEDADEPTPDRPEPTWDAESLEVRFLAACDVDPAHTAAWWADEFAGDEWTLTERDELLGECYAVNMPKRSFDLGVLGKG